VVAGHAQGPVVFDLGGLELGAAIIAGVAQDHTAGGPGLDVGCPAFSGRVIRG
jgi:hypothetical protein